MVHAGTSKQMRPNVTHTILLLNHTRWKRLNNIMSLWIRCITLIANFRRHFDSLSCHLCSLLPFFPLLLSLAMRSPETVVNVNFQLGSIVKPINVTQAISFHCEARSVFYFFPTLTLRCHQRSIIASISREALPTKNDFPDNHIDAIAFIYICTISACVTDNGTHLKFKCRLTINRSQ